jgi:hypothetical protein
MDSESIFLLVFGIAIVFLLYLVYANERTMNHLLGEVLRLEDMLISTREDVASLSRDADDSRRLKL